MKWDERLNKAIDYIEANLEDKIDIDKVASAMCQTKASFQRTFSLIMDISINEYIRKRRMTLAAIELRNSTVKVIDLALRFGYECVRLGLFILLQSFDCSYNVLT